MKVEGLVVPPHRFRKYRWVVPLDVEHPTSIGFINRRQVDQVTIAHTLRR